MYSTVFHGSKCPKAVCLTVCNFLDSRDSQWGGGPEFPICLLTLSSQKFTRDVCHQMSQEIHVSPKRKACSRFESEKDKDRPTMGHLAATWPPGGQLFWVPDPAELSVTYRTRYWRSSSSESSNHNLMHFFHEGHCCTPREAAKKSQRNWPCGKPNDINLQSLADFCHQFLVAYNQYMISEFMKDWNAMPFWDILGGYAFPAFKPRPQNDTRWH